MQLFSVLRRMACCRSLLRFFDPETERLRRFVGQCAATAAPDAVVIDVGAGESPYRELFTRQRYFGVDFGRGDRSWDYRQLDIFADIHRLPLQENIADRVVCTQVLEHVPDPLTVLSEIARILKPSGELFLSAPQGWGEHQVPHDFFRYTRYGLTFLCDRAGLEIITITGTSGYFGYLANRLTMIPKILFGDIKSPWLRLLLAPVEIACYLLFVAIPPLLVEPFDIFDKQRTYTLNYIVVARKKVAGR